MEEKYTLPEENKLSVIGEEDITEEFINNYEDGKGETEEDENE